MLLFFFFLVFLLLSEKSLRYYIDHSLLSDKFHTVKPFVDIFCRADSWQRTFSPLFLEFSFLKVALWGKKSSFMNLFIY